MNSDLSLAVVITLLGLLPVVMSVGYAIAFRSQLTAKRRFVFVGSWLAYGVYGAILAGTGPIILGFESLLSGVCGADDSLPPAVTCIVGRWLYEFGWLIAIAGWLVLSVVAIHKLAKRYWNPLVGVIWGRHES